MSLNDYNQEIYRESSTFYINITLKVLYFMTLIIEVVGFLKAKVFFEMELFLYWILEKM